MKRSRLLFFLSKLNATHQFRRPKRLDEFVEYANKRLPSEAVLDSDDRDQISDTNTPRQWLNVIRARRRGAAVREEVAVAREKDRVEDEPAVGGRPPMFEGISSFWTNVRNRSPSGQGATDV